MNMHTPTRGRRAQFRGLARLGIALVAIAGLSLLTACEQPNSGIFAGIEREREIENRNLPDNAAANGVARAGDSYFASMGDLYRLPPDSDSSTSDWQPVPQPTGDSTWLSLSVAAQDNTLYVAYQTVAGEAAGVYAYTYDGAAENGKWTWSEEAVYEGTAGPVQRFFSFDTDGDGVTDSVVSLESVQDGTAQDYRLVFDVFGSPTATDNPVNRIIDAAYDTEDDQYWFVSSSYLYVGADAATVARQTSDDLSARSETLTGAAKWAGIEANGGQIFLTTQSGSLIIRDFSEDTATWRDGAISVTDAAPLSDVGYIPAAGDAQIFIGVKTSKEGDGSGYYTMPIDGDTPTRPSNTDPSYESAELSEADIVEFQLFPEEEDALFIVARTADRGMWSRTLSSQGTFTDWRWE
jgi:hypothetical protein